MSQEEKNRLRERLKKERIEFAKNEPEQKRQQDALIIMKVLELPVLQDATEVLVYESLKSEVDTSKLIEILEDLGKEIIIPQVISMSPPKMKLVYKNNTRQQDRVSAIDCAIIPGIGFDPQLNRIGFGKGFFDMLFHGTTFPKVALSYDFQIVQNVPVETHDEKITYIITPTTIYE